MAKVAKTVELSLAEFNSLPTATAGARQKKVDWDRVLGKIRGKPMTVAQIADVAATCLLPGQTKSTVYYSEVLGFLKRKAGKIQRRVKTVDGRQRVYILVE